MKNDLDQLYWSGNVKKRQLILPRGNVKHTQIFNITALVRTREC